MEDKELKKAVITTKIDFTPQKLNLPAEQIAKLKEQAQQAKKTEISTSSSSGNEGFASVEHRAIGATAFKEFMAILERSKIKVLFEALTKGKFFDPTTLEFTLSDKVKLKAGDIIALAGDFYAIPNKPISEGDEEEGKNRFETAYHTLVNAKPDEVDKILKQIDVEMKIITEAVKAKKKPSLALRGYGDIKGNAQYALITRYSFCTGSRYLDIAEKNYDHFGTDALRAYQIGHKVALHTATQAGQEQDLSKSLQGFVKAMTEELFACHFLTDLFAAGHIRTPRRKVVEYVKSKAYLPGKEKMAGFLVKAMHDEENTRGVKVNSIAHPVAWTSYGDEMYFEPIDQENMKQVCTAVTIALGDIYNAFGNHGECHTVLDYIPQPTKDNDLSPMFKFDEDDKELKVRNDLFDPHCKTYRSNWQPETTFFSVKTGKKHSNSDGLSPQEKKHIEDDLQQLEKAEEKVECKLS